MSDSRIAEESSTIHAQTQSQEDNPDSSAPAGGSPNDFLSYKRIELGCVTDLKRIIDLSVKTKINPSIVDLTREVLSRIENKRFLIAVVGEFKRGKSTFINALLGKNILPSDVEPCSATLNRVTYALRPSVTIHYKAEPGEQARTEEIDITQLSEYVTKLTPQSESNAAQVEEAIVHYPTEYCRNNVDIIDTPGLNDDDTMTAVTMSVLPKVDAAILVIMPEAPFDHYEGEFLTRHLLLNDLGRVLFVVNAMDRLRSPRDREKIVKVIEKRITDAVDMRLREQFDPASEDFKRYRQQIGNPTVFPLSSALALEAQESDNKKLMEESRFSEFTSALEKFLTHGRGTIELQVIANRILATSEEIVKKLNIEFGAISMAQHEFQAKYEQAVAELESLRSRRDAEIRKIDNAKFRTQQRLLPMVARLGDDLAAAAGEVIDATHPTSDDLTKDKLPAFTEDLNKRISSAVKLRVLRSSEALQLEIERDFQVEIERLKDFAVNVGETLGGIEQQFGTVQLDPSEQATRGNEAIVAAISVFTGFGGIWSGYREAGFKGAAVGGVASVGTFFVGGLLLGAISLPLSLPIMIGLGLISIFTGGKMARWAFSEDRAERFMTRYRKEILQRIDEEVRSRNLSHSVDENNENLFATLKDRLIGELSRSIDQTQATLDGLRDNRARNEVLDQRSRQESEEIRDEVIAIRSKALRLSNQLAEITHV
ncbi:dynamin family protein [Granulicella sibirica]|uniref:Dynamin N-terminal domain-containing protein n=1 Tax=Granulicella sibirica TaxID=2479048 RepID=A0A4Q0SYU0_9BACT|nr:dynamin family protein [Granulicella sibirica]RXH54216.1 hypothetical protein GRAN_4867 [Granulicella sibirica]